MREKIKNATIHHFGYEHPVTILVFRIFGNRG